MATNSFDLTNNHTALLGWIQFYDMLYSLDEVERPPDQIMNNDARLDDWYKSYHNNVLQRLKEYHKSIGTKHVDRGLPKPRRGYVMGG